MVVIMVIDGERFGGLGTKQLSIFGAPGDGLRRSRAANMPIKTDDPVRFRHNEVQIMGHKQYAASQLIPKGPDKFIEGNLAGEIHPLYGLIKHEQIRVPEYRPGEERTLELAAGQPLDRCIGEMADADGVKGLFRVRWVTRSGQRHKPPHRKRQRPVNLQSLWHIADAERARLGNSSGVGPKQPQDRFYSRAFSTSVWSDERDDLTATNRYIDVPNHPFAAEINADSAGVEQRFSWLAHGLSFSAVWHPKVRFRLRAATALLSVLLEALCVIL